MKTLLAFTCLLLPTFALAHAGHDHSHWSSYFVHAALALPVLGAIIYAIITQVKSRANEE